MQVINLGENNTVLNQYIQQLRDKVIQKDPMRFRMNLERVGGIFGYEISKTFEYSQKEVCTPLGIASINTPDDNLVVSTILRAGLPLHEGILNMFENAQSAFIAAFRKYSKGDDFKIDINYCTTPPLDGKVLILADTMLATGASMLVAYDKLVENGEPKHTHIVSVVASTYAVETLKKSFPGSNATLWTAAIDEELTTHSYIVPGLGDAGDLAYGEKL